MQHLPRLRLAQTPTPLQPLPRLSAYLGGPEIWLKREDQTGDIGLGGNKARKLEFLLADAKAQGATVVLTTGGPQSNHARATAAACARLGMRCVLVLAGSAPRQQAGNLLLGALYGAEVRFPGAFTPADQAQALEDAAAELAASGERPYIIPGGGSNPLGTCGSYLAYAELREQAPNAQWLVSATGTGSTHGGLLLGKLLHGDPVQIIGFSVWLPAAETAARTEQLVREAARLLGRPLGDPAPHLRVEDAWHPRYGKASEAGMAALRDLARLEGIVLDPVYTGKAMAGLIQLIRAGEIGSGEQVVFLHTGGAPALFAGNLPL